MQTDPCIGMCMAFDVYLVIFRRWSPQQVKQVFKWYIPLCYGLPLVPALTCLLFRNKQGDRIFGNAAVCLLLSSQAPATDKLQIWCWIDNEYAYVRIYSYYGPVWIYLLVTFIIYIRVGIEIFRKRSALRAFGSGGLIHTSLISRCSSVLRSGNRKSRVDMSSLTLPAFTGTRTTEVEVISTQNQLPVPAPTHSRSSQGQERENYTHTVNITATQKELRRSLPDIARDWFDSLMRSFDGMDPVKVAYAKCASLFFLSIIVTWVPSSANRVYGLLHPSRPSYSLNIAAAAVLPLQGFWNTIIFFWISWNIVTDQWHDLRHGKATQRIRANTSTEQIQMAERGQRGIRINKGGETESTRAVLEDDIENCRLSENTRNSSVRTTIVRPMSSP
jgi:hypothetical protein